MFIWQQQQKNSDLFISRDLPHSVTRIKWMQHNKVLYKEKTNIICGHVNQYTRLKMSAVTLLPFLPPNWKLGVGNSSTSSNPVRQHRENVQVKKGAFCKLPGHQHAVKHRWQKSFPADYGQRQVRRRTASQKLSIHHLCYFLGPSKDRLSVWRMRCKGPLAPCRLSTVTALRRVTATGSAPKFWLYKAVVACSLTTCQVTD